MIKETLRDNWKMQEAGASEGFITDVPASVLSVLLDNGIIEDPFYRDNETKCRKYLEKDYEFIRMISASGDILSEDNVDLVFYGLDTVADIYLNGQLLKRADNMHRTYRFPIKDRLIPGSNEIKLVFHSPLKYINEYEPAENKEIKYIPCNCEKGNQYIRKAHSMFGWDWGPQLPDIGVFRDVELQAYSKARIKEVIIKQSHDYGQVNLYIDPILEIYDSIPLEIVVNVTGQKEEVRVIRMPEPGQKETPKEQNKLTILIERPELWWPNGMGSQKLYTVKVAIKKAGIIYDEVKYKIGLRDITISQEKDEYGKEFAFKINGEKMFAMGADYIPEDAIYSRINKEKIEKLIRSAAKANYNCLRVWGGGYYPSDEFYDLCDEYGIIVWQDFMFACNVYDLTEEFEENITQEVIENVTRIRHHASLGLWCGNNEIESGWSHWPDFQKENNYLRADYLKIFEHVIPKALRSADDATFYWPSSPSSGGSFDNPDDEDRGDAHYWDVWHGQKPFTEYRNHHFRFLSEFGFQSFPSMKTVESFTLPEDHNIFSYVMEQHQKNGWANGKILYYISENFLYPKNFESLLYVSQILQGMAIKYGVEHFRRNRGRCMGTLYWQINDNWPVASWSSIDYYGRWKALHYMARDFYEPLAGSLRRTIDSNGKQLNRFTSFVVNDTAEGISFKVRQSLYNIDGKEIAHFDDSGRAGAGKVISGREHDFERYIKSKGAANVYVEAEFMYADGRSQIVTETFVPYKHMNLKLPEVCYGVTELDDAFEITLTSDTFTPFVVMDVDDRDVIFESNVISLTANKTYYVYLLKSEISGEPFRNADDLCDHLTLNYLQKSYMVFPEEVVATRYYNGYDNEYGEYVEESVPVPEYVNNSKSNKVAKSPEMMSAGVGYDAGAAAYSEEFEVYDTREEKQLSPSERGIPTEKDLTEGIRIKNYNPTIRFATGVEEEGGHTLRQFTPSSNSKPPIQVGAKLLEEARQQMEQQAPAGALVSGPASAPASVPAGAQTGPLSNMGMGQEVYQDAYQDMYQETYQETYEGMGQEMYGDVYQDVAPEMYHGVEVADVYQGEAPVPRQSAASGQRQSAAPEPRQVRKKAQTGPLPGVDTRPAAKTKLRGGEAKPQPLTPPRERQVSRENPFADRKPSESYGNALARGNSHINLHGRLPFDELGEVEELEEIEENDINEYELRRLLDNTGDMTDIFSDDDYGLFDDPDDTDEDDEE